MDKFSKLNKISFHDSYITKIKFSDNNLYILIDCDLDGKDYEIFIKNVNIEIQNYKESIINYTIDQLNNINEESLYLFSMHLGYEDNKEVLKIWIDYPAFLNEYSLKGDNKIFSEIIPKLSNEYDDYGRIFIKFIGDLIDIVD